MARPLRLISRVRTPDPDLIDRLGRAMYQRDETGARLVAAMRRDAPAAERVTMAQFNRALHDGLDAVPDAAPALREFFDQVERVPDWVDFSEVERGARIFRRFGPSRQDVLLQLSLIGGYRYGGPADLLVLTGGLTGSTAMRRLAETQKWAESVGLPGGMRRDGEGFRLTVHVRLMHALVNDRFERNGRWDVDRWGLPVNQADQAATLGLFNSTLLLGMRLLGRVITRQESRAVMHLWKYVGWVMGVDEQWLCDTERQQNALNYHVVLVQDDVTPAGPELAGALVDGHLGLYDGPFGGQRGRYERARLLGMLRFFLGREGIDDLKLPVRLPWGVPPAVARNLVESLVVNRTRAGRRLLERRADESLRRSMRRFYGAPEPKIGALPS